MTPDFSEQRSAMVDSQLRTCGVNDPAVIAAFTSVPRERFVPPARAATAYVDNAVALAPGRAMLEPLVLALLLTHLAIERGERVLIVGAGTGYSAAIVAAITPHVTALEELPALIAAARANGVAAVAGPLTAGWPGDAPYDVILFDGAVADVPEALLAQLADRGRIGAVIVGTDGIGRATVGRYIGGHFGGSGFIEASAPLLPGFARPRQFVF